MLAQTLETRRSVLETMLRMDGSMDVSRVRKKAAKGTLIRRVRELRGLTQEQLADRSGMSFQNVGHIERGTRAQRDPIQKYRQLAEGLDVLPSDLIGERDELSVAIEYAVGLSTASDMPAEGPVLPRPWLRAVPPPGLARSHECFAAWQIDDSADRRFPPKTLFYVRRAEAMNRRFRREDRVLLAHYGVEPGKRVLFEVLQGVLEVTAGGGVILLTNSNNRQVPPALVLQEAGESLYTIAGDTITAPAPGKADRFEILGKIERADVPV